MPTGPGLYFSSCDGVAVGARILSRPVPRQQIAEHALPVASADAASIRWMAPALRNAAPHGQSEIIATEPGICRRRDTAQTTACWHDGLHGNAICRLLRHAVHGKGAAVTRRVQLSLANQIFEVLQAGISLARDLRTNPGEECAKMDLGVFIPIGNNGWPISTASPQYRPSFDLNREVVQKAERYGFEFALSMIKLRASAARASSGTTTSNRSH